MAALEQVLDLKTAGFEDIVGRLKAYEERVADDEEPKEDQSKLLYANNETPSNREKNNEYRGRGRGRGSNYRGRGRGRNNGAYNGAYNGPRDASRITCFRCDKVGHYVYQCPDRLLKLQEVQENENNETQEADELMMQEVVYLNEGKIVPSKYEENNSEDNVWYLDNGASNHMSGDKRYFAFIDDSISGKVRFGDDSRIDIKGKGTIEFTDRNGEPRKITDAITFQSSKVILLALDKLLSQAVT